MTEMVKADAPKEGEKGRREGSTLEREIAAKAPVVGPLLVLAAAIAGGFLQGPPGVLLALAAGALLGVIWILWASLRTFLGETPLEGADAYALAAPRAEEEQKRAVLRALKDLEFERGVGKISEEDYNVLVAKYRAEGKRLLQKLDTEAAPRRERVERLIAKRLREDGLAAVKESQKARETKGDAEPALPAEDTEDAALLGGAAEGAGATEPLDEDARPTCAACGTENDPDAVFCKKCGKRQGAEEPAAQEGPSS